MQLVFYSSTITVMHGPINIKIQSLSKRAPSGQQDSCVSPCILKANIHVTIPLNSTEVEILPYFLIDNARVIYTKKV